MDGPFWLDVKQLLAGHSPYRSTSQLYKAIRQGDWLEPTRIGGRSLWRSDEVHAANERLAERAKAEAEGKARAAAERAARLTRARGSKRK